MGRVIFDAFQESDFVVYAFDPAEAAQKYIKKTNAHNCRTPHEVAQNVSILILSLPTPEIVKQVIIGKDGVLGKLDSEIIIIDTSTIDPKTAIEMNALCHQRCASAYLDSPILGRPDSFGKWVLPVGGDEDKYKKITTILKVFSNKSFYVGGSGSGFALKLLNQMMFSVINGITAEMLATSHRIGVDPKTVYEVISSSGAGTVSGLFLECGKKITTNDYSPVFPIRLLCKDAGLGLEMARELGAPPIISTTVQMYNELAKSKGYGDLDTSALYTVFSDIYTNKGEL
jgi:3-hydroxyisobutyrate dehydrogenase-like beta-hydroxyacid dehydrogenase